MKKNGFTLVEVLAVLIILSLLIILVVSAFLKMFTKVKRGQYYSTIDRIESAALQYGQTIKDEIKEQRDINNSCYILSVEELIEKGYLQSEDDVLNVIYSPVDSSKMEYPIYACYCEAKLDIDAYYAQYFNPTLHYFEGDKVFYDGDVYECIHDYYDSDEIKDKKGILSTYYAYRTTKFDKSDAAIRNYFVKVEC